MEYLLIGMLCAVVCGVIAAGKNRSAVGWGVVGFFLPIIGVVATLCLPRVASLEELVAQAEIAQFTASNQFRNQA